MKETKKMMGVIEQQYRKANEEYRRSLKRQQKIKDIQTNIMYASLLINVVIILSCIAKLYW